MNSLDYIERLVIDFKNGIEIAKDRGLLKEMPFLIFPRACCDDASDLLSQYLLENGITSKLVSGSYRYDDFDNIYSHVWIEVEGNIIIDITCSQYKNNLIFSKYKIKDYYIGKINKFYKLFEIEWYKEFRGLNYYGEKSYERLNRIYNVILENINRK